MLGRRASTTADTASLSAFAQSVAYVVARLGPFDPGALHDLTGSWSAPVAMIMVAAVLLGVLGTLVDRGGTIEDDLAARR